MKHIHIQFKHSGPTKIRHSKKTPNMFYSEILKEHQDMKFILKVAL